jgi:hypothetical protein
MPPVKLFVSYSHKDEALMEELFEFLQPLKIANKIEIWNDKAIPVGSIWDDEIKNALDEADIFLFLISPSFLASNYINRIEIARAFELRSKGKKIVPIMLRPCDVDSHIVPGQEYRISDFMGLPKDRKPIIKWETHEDGWIDVVNGLKRVCESITK